MKNPPETDQSAAWPRGEISQLLLLPELKLSLNRSVPTYRLTGTLSGVLVAPVELRITLPLYCPTASVLLLAVTAIVVGAAPLVGFALSHVESVLPVQFITPDPALLTVVFCEAGLRVVAPKKFNELGDAARIVGWAATVNCTEMLTGEFWAPLETAVMVSLQVRTARP